MDLIQNLIDFLKQPESETRDNSPQGLCPVCWGYQEYDHKIRKLYRDRQLEVNNHRASYMVMENFVVTHLDGIKLKEGETHECPTCSEIESKHASK